MAEKVVKLNDDAVRALETIRGNRNESVEATLGRLIGTGAEVAKEIQKGGKVQITEQNGTVKDVPL